jgi:hypothetical protein
MRIGDVSRPRRFADPIRLRWYAKHRAVRFARRMGIVREVIAGTSRVPRCVSLG